MIYLILLACSAAATLRLSNRRLAALVLIAFVATLASNPLQSWGIYHYHLGSKYFDELGYFDLYECSTAAAKLGEIPRRDLNDYTFRFDTPNCAAQFTPARWQAFREDLSGELFETQFMRDKGLNATPTWILLGELLSGLGVNSLVMLDMIILAGALGLAGYLVGWRKAGLSALFILVFYGTYGRLWGHFGQWWWLALAIVGVTLLKKRHGRTGGFLIGLSASLAIFPIFLALGRSKTVIKWSMAGLALGLFVGLGTSRGLSAYPDFVQNMALHSSHIKSEPFNIGLQNTLIMAASTPDILSSWLDCFRGNDCATDYQFASPTLLWMLLLPMVATTRFGLMYGVLTLSRYYYQILAVIPFESPESHIRGLFALNAVMIAWTLIDRESQYQFGHLLWIAYFGWMGISNMRRKWI